MQFTALVLRLAHSRPAGYGANVVVLASGTRVAGRPLGVRLSTWRHASQRILARCACSHQSTYYPSRQDSLGDDQAVQASLHLTYASPASRTWFSGRMIGDGPASIPAWNALPAAGAVSGIIVPRHITVPAVRCCQPLVRFLPRRTSETILAVWRVKPRFAVQALSPCGVGLRPRITILAWRPIRTVAL